MLATKLLDIYSTLARDLRRSKRIIIGDSRVRSSNQQRRFHFSGRRLATSTPVISSTSPLLPPRPHQPHRRASPPLRAIAISSRVAPSSLLDFSVSPLSACARAVRKASRSTRALSPEATFLHLQPSTLSPLPSVLEIHAQTLRRQRPEGGSR